MDLYIKCVLRFMKNKWRDKNIFIVLVPCFRLKEYCERLMFYNPVEYGRKAEEVLWRKVFYDTIQLVKKNRRVGNTCCRGTLCIVLDTQKSSFP